MLRATDDPPPRQGIVAANKNHRPPRLVKAAATARPNKASASRLIGLSAQMLPDLGKIIRMATRMKEKTYT
jgi:hypothetical protein